MLLYLRFVLEKTTALWLFTSPDFSRGYIFQSCSFLVCVRYQLAFLHASNLRKPSGNIIEWSMDCSSSEFIWLISLPNCSVRSKKKNKEKGKACLIFRALLNKELDPHDQLWQKGWLGSTSLSQNSNHSSHGKFPLGPDGFVFFHEKWLSWCYFGVFQICIACGQTWATVTFLLFCCILYDAHHVHIVYLKKEK